MAEAASKRQHGRRSPPPPPNAGQLLAVRLQRWIARAFDAAAERWVLLVGLVTLLLFVVLSQWSERLAGSIKPSARCVLSALGTTTDGGDPPCAEQLRALVSAAPIGDADTCAPGGRNTERLCALQEPGYPRLFVWSDNILVALYTLFFIAFIASAYDRLRPSGRSVPHRRQLAFILSIAACLAAAALDLGENFWLLARIGLPLDEQAAGLRVVAGASLWKFRLIGLSLVLTLGWGAWAAWRRRFPHALLFPWPHRCWDKLSRGWFDPSGVRYDVANAACAHPLYPRDLMGLAGAPIKADLRCERDGHWLRIQVHSPMLAHPHVVDVELDETHRGVSNVRLTCPDLSPALRAQGLAERMVLASCRSAWRLGAATIESVVRASDDELVRAQNRRWVRMALHLGWDAELPDAMRQALPPGLAHLDSLQQLMTYPDGRSWWSTVNFALTLRFVCKPERAQVDQRQIDRERLATDHKCMARLNACAVELGIRLGL